MEAAVCVGLKGGVHGEYVAICARGECGYKGMRSSYASYIIHYMAHSQCFSSVSSLDMACQFGATQCEASHSSSSGASCLLITLPTLDQHESPPEPLVESQEECERNRALRRLHNNPANGASFTLPLELSKTELIAQGIKGRILGILGDGPYVIDLTGPENAGFGLQDDMGNDIEYIDLTFLDDQEDYAVGGDNFIDLTFEDDEEDFVAVDASFNVIIDLTLGE